MRRNATLVVLLAIVCLGGSATVYVTATPDERTIEAIASSARLLPRFVDGQPISYRVVEVQPGSLLHRIGLRNEDEIQSVNGQPVSQEFLADKILNLFASADLLVLEVASASQPVRVLRVRISGPKEA